MESVTLTEQEFEMLVRYTMRYAMGRKSYIFSEITELIEQYNPFFSSTFRNSIILEIERKLIRSEEMGGFLGDAFDHRHWQTLVKKLKSLENRE
jgi:hypothetical protein